MVRIRVPMRVLPPRTRAHWLTDSKSGMPLSEPFYVCVDCGHGTEKIEGAFAHQRYQHVLHTRWQRFKRWLTLLWY